MPTIVHDLELPEVDALGLGRHESREVLEAARAQHWLARTPLGYIVMPSTPPRVGRQLEAWGFTVVESPVHEFLKAGGGCRCLTLALDTVLSA